MKKRSYGKDKWNGIGGKLDKGETVEEAAIRETQEEIEVTPLEPTKRALLSFFVRKNDGTVEPEMKVHVFECLKWEGAPTETEEMRPHWFALEDIPYDAMWPDDAYWLPTMLEGKTQEGEFYFNEDYEIVDHSLRAVESAE